MTYQIFAVIAPVLLIAAIGYIWDRRGLPFDAGMVSYLAPNIGAPCLLLSALLTKRPELGAMLQTALAASLLVLITAALGYVILRVLKQPIQPYLPSMIFPNAGNMGIPLAMFAFGDDGLVAAVAFFAAMSLWQFSLGMALASGRVDLRSTVFNPTLWAMVIAMVMLHYGLSLPRWLGNTVDVLSGLVIPLMILSLGTSLARLKINTLGRSAVYAAFRLVFGFAVSIMLCRMIGLTGAARGAMIIQSSMPAAVFNYMFALRYDNRPSEVAGIVVVSTVLSFLTLPLLLAYVLG